MKRYFKYLFVLVVMLFIPFCIYAQEEYESFDFKAQRVDGNVINDTKISIYASTSSKEELTNRTSEFNFDEVMWSVCEEIDCSLTRGVSDEEVFEEGKEYTLLVRITPKDGSSIFNTWEIEKIKYNGVTIDQLSGEFGNTGNELMIKTKISDKQIAIPETIEEDNSNPTPGPTDVEAIGDLEETCMTDPSLCCDSFCCNTFLNISVCIWLIIIAVLLLLIIVLCLSKKKNKEE